MPKAPAPKLPLPTPPSPALVRTRVEGIKLINPLKTEVAAIHIKDAHSYLQADFALAKVNAAIASWEQKFNPVLAPVQETLVKAKLAVDAVKVLDDEIRGPLVELQKSLKSAMKDYKVLEAQQIRERKALAEREAAERRSRALAVTTAAALAKTPGARAKLEERQAELEQEAAQIVEQAVIESAPVKGAASTDRTVTKLRIKDPMAFLAAVKDYEPKAGLYNMGHPPLTLLTRKMNRIGMLAEKDSAMETVLTELGKIYSVQPGVVLSWPGVEEYDDVIIANR